jgi:hypothetical protein
MSESKHVFRLANEVNGVIVVPFNNYSVPGYIHWHY